MMDLSKPDNRHATVEGTVHIYLHAQLEDTPSRLLDDETSHPQGGSAITILCYHAVCHFCT